MTKSQLAQVISKQNKLSKKAADEILDNIFDEIAKALSKGEKVVISGFGTFWTNRVEDKEVVPFGKEELRQIIKAHNAVNFKVGKPLKKLVW